MTVCNLDYKEAGPFAQTLFLGCSVSQMTLNFAWGSEASTCTLKLVKDTSAHPAANDFSSIDTRIETIINNNTNDPQTFNSDTLNMNDPANTLQQSLAVEEKKREDYRDQYDVTEMPENKLKDQGKKCWDIHNLSANPINWVGPDPGFIGDDSFLGGNVYQSVGVPVYFKFDEIEFGGLINKWSYAGGLYDVTIQGPGSILKGCNLILNNYYGSISTEIPNAIALADGSTAAAPCPDLEFPNNGGLRPFNANIYRGNIPNLINIFGYANYYYGFGALDISEAGISAAQVYDILKEMLNNADGIQKNPFNPYGAIVTRSLIFYGNQGTDGTYSIVNPQDRTINFAGSSINFTQLGFMNHKLAIDNVYRPLFRLDMTNIPRPPEGVYLEMSSNMPLDEFITLCCDGAGFDWNCTMVPDLSSSDFSGRIVINTYNRNIQTPTKVLRNFVNNMSASDRVISFDLGEAHNAEDNVRKVAVGAKQQRLYQVMCNTLSQYRNIHRFDPETMQWSTERSDLSEQYLLAGNSRNQLREPLANSTRPWDSSWGDNYRTYGGAIATQINNDFLSIETAWSNRSMLKGNYETRNPILATGDQIPVVTPSPGNPNAVVTSPAIIGGNAYPIFLDLISPYFGRHGNGNLRQVFYDRGVKQLWINVALDDILTFFPNIPPSFSGGKTLSICENEMRAAIAGMDSWLTYIFEPLKLGFTTPTTKLIRAWLQHRYGTTLGNALILQGIPVLDAKTKTSALPAAAPHTNAINPANKMIYDEQVYPVLQNLHNYIASDIGSHYGTEYAIRIPFINRRVDSLGKAHYDYEVVDSGWEEFGNFIDDTIQMGSDEAFALAESDGRFGPLLGYNASHEKTPNRPDRTNNPGSALFKCSLIGRIMTHSMGSMNAPGQWYQPLDIENMSAEDLIVVNWQSYMMPGQKSFGGVPAGKLVPNQFPGDTSVVDSFGNTIPDNLKFKAYTRASLQDVMPENRINTKILYTPMANYAVVKSNNPVMIKGKNSCKHVMLEDLFHSAMYGYQLPQLGQPQTYTAQTSPINPFYILYLLVLHNGNEMSSALMPSITAENKDNLPISAKAAIPCFAAIPVQYNLRTYGPWTTHPGTIATDIFPGENDNNVHVLTNNIVGGVEVDINDSYAPWDYGGMTNLDTAVLTNLAEANRYQQIQEEGTIQVANILFRNGSLGARAINSNGPMINSINVSIGADGIKSTYHFRSFTRKLGFYNRFQSKNAQLFGKERIANRKIIADSRRKTMEAVRQRRQTGRAASSSDLPKALSHSPATVLVGGALPMVHQDSLLEDAFTQLGYNPYWSYRPKTPNTVTMSPKDSIFHSTIVSMYDPDEIPRTVLNAQNYASMSLMSLDGLFSPISFYPTAHATTYPIAPYPRSKCPICKGLNTYTYKKYTSARTDFDKNSTQVKKTADILNSFTDTTEACPFCKPDDQIKEKKKKSHTPNEMTPPYLIASGTNNIIINNRDVSVQLNAGTINQYTLNPLVMSATGSDFSNIMHKQSNDKCGHSIGAVSFGNVLPEPADGLNASLSKTINKNYNDYDLNLIAADPTNTKAFQNLRSFGFRGPLMVHGWGYDLEGYPVPNSSGELKLNGAGGYVLDNEGNPVGKNQVLQADGTYSAPYKENTFYKGWAQQPGSWPVGPVDLRWDDNANVWTVGANYKPVWVVLETDLLNDEPVRGIIVESSYSNTPLPSGLKKLIFVKDSLGMFSAPRGAALYCKYDSANGFYEPIYNRPLVTTGTILGGNSATIYKAYTPSLVSEDEVSSYNTTFANPLLFDTAAGEVGLFTFIDGEWVLQSIRS